MKQRGPPPRPADVDGACQRLPVGSVGHVVEPGRLEKARRCQDRKHPQQTVQVEQVDVLDEVRWESRRTS